jgi:DNA-binding transcriptional MocR family regulator
MNPAKTGVRSSPLYEQVASEFRRKIDLGVLRIGEKLPSVRSLRSGRRVSTATVMEAYLRLEREGYVRVRDRSGFYVVQPPGRTIPRPSTGRVVAAPLPVGISALVAEVLSQVGSHKLVPLGVSTIDPALLPMPRLNRAIRRVLARSPLHSATYTDLSGAAALRRQIARRALALGTAADADEVIVTAGGLDALNLALRAVASPGDVVAVESPTYFGVLQAVEAVGLRALEIPADSHTGIDLNLLEQALKRHHVKAVLVMTTCHNPLGTVMSDDAKKELVGLTARYNVALVEDGAYAELAYDAGHRRPAKAFDQRGLVVYCGSFSKVLAPGLRIGWIEAGRFTERIRAYKGITSLMTSSLPQLALAELLESRYFDRHIKRLRLRVAEQTRRYAQAVRDALPSGTRMTAPAGGNLLWVQLPGADGTQVYRRLLQQGVGIFPGEIFSLRGKHRSFLRVSCGASWSPAIERAIDLLGRTVGNAK